MNNEFCLNIAQLAVKSLLFEVSATPKPGLVDRRNSGAHKDMDFFSFMASSSVLFHTFYNCALEGVSFNSSNYKELLSRIRPIGITGEEKMFSATNGVNTHKGLIFLMGIISAALGSLYIERDYKGNISTQEICDRVKEMTEGISDKELQGIKNKEKLTYGEKLFLKYGVKGIRGEVESGFRTVLNFGLPVIRGHLKEGKSCNDVLVHVLLNLMTKTEDSNVLGRHDMSVLNYVKHCAERALKLGGAFTKEGMQFIRMLDKDFIEKNISPGGAADLLAVTIMFYFLETDININKYNKS
jgi:triphosphoribosyl-dephospho-CoA synthase